MRTRDELPILFEYLNHLGRGVEVGVKEGHNAMTIKKHYTGTLFCVDIWRNRDDYEQAKANLAGLATLIPKDSLTASQDFTEGSLDFVYIDANHGYEYVKEDLNAWYPKVRVGGIVSGHDYLDGDYDGLTGTPFGVKRAVDEFVAQYGKTLFVTTDDYWQGKPFNSWYFVK